jgi:hypothetical protein
MLDPFGTSGHLPRPDSATPQYLHVQPTREPVPLDARIERMTRGWSIRIPLLREEVSVGMEIVVVEEVAVGIRPVSEVAQVTGTVRREELLVETHGDLDQTRPLQADEVAEIERLQHDPEPQRRNR